MTNEEILIQLNEIRIATEKLMESITESNAANRWSEADITYVKTMKQMFGDACWVYRSKDSGCVTLAGKSKNVIMRMYDNPFSFRQLGPGEYVKLDDIIGGAE